MKPKFSGNHEASKSKRISDSVPLAIKLAAQFRGLRYALVTRWSGLDFAFMSAEDAGLDSTVSVHHGTSGGPELLAIMRCVPIHRDSRIIDVGSGKGGALLTLARLPFAEVAGLEYSATLHQIAQTNAQKAKQVVTLIHGNATDFADFDRFTHLYMYNPFSTVIMAPMVANLNASLLRRPRDFWVIYRNPYFADVLQDSGLFQRKEEVRMPPSMLPTLIFTHAHP